MKLFDLTGRKAIVTGSTRGLGHGMAEGLMEAGCEVVVVGSGAGALKVAQDFADKGFLCHGIAIDLSDRARRREGFASAVELLGGRLDILVNAAGIQRRHFCEEFPMEDWDAVLEVNLTATFELCQLAGQQFIRQGSKGKIVNIASLSAERGGRFAGAHYACSKGGVVVMTKVLALRGGEYGITANAIAPGLIKTAMAEQLAFSTDDIPLGRLGTPEEIAETALFLASDRSSYMTGATLDLNGGQLMR